MVKRKDQCAPVEEDMYTLQNMWKLGMQNQDPTRSTLELYKICDEQDACDNNFKCAMCLTAYHESCAENMLPRNRPDKRVKLRIVDLSEIFSLELVDCILCRHLLGQAAVANAASPDDEGIISR